MAKKKTIVNKTGKEVKSKKCGNTWKIILIIIIALILIFVISSNINTTGNATASATLTHGASYGKISTDFNGYVNCSVVGDNDGWDVTKTGIIKYYTSDGKGPYYVRDVCESTKTVKEYYCDSDGMRERRSVVCPSSMSCSEGNCVSS